MSTTEIPTGEYEDRKVRDIRAGDRAFIDGEWRIVEAGGSWPESPNTVELTTEPHSEGFTFSPSVSLPVATGEVGSRPEGDFVLRIKLGNAAMCRPEHVAQALRSVAQQIEDHARFYGDRETQIRDINGNRVGGYGLSDEAGQ